MPSSALRARQRCCKSGCLHCPYGYTLKKFGLKFTQVSDLNSPDFLQMVSSPNLGDKEAYHWVSLKDVTCAVIKVNHLFVLEVYLLQDFADQGLSKEIIESYFFY